MDPSLRYHKTHTFNLLVSMYYCCYHIFEYISVCVCVFQVFTRECMGHYLRVFNFLWRAKRMEYTLTDIWKGQMCNAKLLKSMPGTKITLFSSARVIVILMCLCCSLPRAFHPAELSGVLHQCHILASEMVHFIHQMQYYITFEVRALAAPLDHRL